MKRISIGWHNLSSQPIADGHNARKHISIGWHNLSSQPIADGHNARKRISIGWHNLSSQLIADGITQGNAFLLVVTIFSSVFGFETVIFLSANATYFICAGEHCLQSVRENYYFLTHPPTQWVKKRYSLFV